jgi:hypothetical protein
MSELSDAREKKHESNKSLEIFEKPPICGSLTSMSQRTRIAAYPIEDFGVLSSQRTGLHDSARMA